MLTSGVALGKTYVCIQLIKAFTLSWFYSPSRTVGVAVVLHPRPAARSGDIRAPSGGQYYLDLALSGRMV